MVRRLSPARGRLLLAPLLAALFGTLNAPAQTQPVLSRARSWAARMESRLAGFGGNAFRFGRDLAIQDGESPNNVVCVLCSTRIDGAARGDLLVFAGNTYLNGAVQGDVVDLGGRVTLTNKARIGGDLIVFGGRLQQDAASTVGGKSHIIGPIIFLPMVLIVGLFIAGLIILLRVLFGRFGPSY